MSAVPDELRVLRRFAALLAMPAERRGASLAELGRSDPALANDLRSLQAHGDDPASVLGAPLNAALAFADGPVASQEEPARVGGFRVLRRIGSGATSTVFEARSDCGGVPVAIKVPKLEALSERAMHRFEREAAALASLHHPGIARVVSTGVDEQGGVPLPFLVMELVEGRPITQYAADECLGTPRRVELLAQVCDALHFAHTKGVIHRDVKPANILIDRHGRPRVLDFGLARLCTAGPGADAAGTLHGEIIGTPAYMSPEQASGATGRPDHRTDIYSLGVVLFELLSGRLPHEVTSLPLWDAVRTVRENSAPLLPGETGVDLRAIVRAALSREPRERFASAADMAADLRRYLRGERARARGRAGVRLAGRLRRLLRRPAILAMSAAAVIFLVATASWKVESRRIAVDAAISDCVERFVRERHAEDALPATERLREFAVVIAEICGRDMQRQLDAHHELAKSLAALRQHHESEVVYRATRQLALAVQGPGGPDTLRSAIGLAHARLAQDDPAGAIELARTCIAAGRRSPPLRLAQAHMVVGRAFRSLNEAPRAAEAYNRAISVGLADLPRCAAITRQCLVELSTLESDRGNLDAVVRCAEIARGTHGAAGSPSRHQGDFLLYLGHRLLRRGDGVAAEALAREADRALAGVPGAGASPVMVLGGGLWLQGRLGEAAEVFARAAAQAEAERGAGSARYAEAINSLGVCLRDLGRLEDAERELRRALELRRRLYGSEHVLVRNTELSLARTLLLRGGYPESRALAAAALASPRLMEDGASAAEAWAVYGAALSGLGESSAADEAMREACRLRSDSIGDGWRSGYAVDQAAEFLRSCGQPQRAHDVLFRDQEALRLVLGERHTAVRRAASLVRANAARGGCPVPVGEDAAPGQPEL